MGECLNFHSNNVDGSQIMNYTTKKQYLEFIGLHYVWTEKDCQK